MHIRATGDGPPVPELMTRFPLLGQDWQNLQVTPATLRPASPLPLPVPSSVRVPQSVPSTRENSQHQLLCWSCQEH